MDSDSASAREISRGLAKRDAKNPYEVYNTLFSEIAVLQDEVISQQRKRIIDYAGACPASTI